MTEFEKWMEGLDWDHDPPKPPEPISQEVHEREWYMARMYERLYPEEAPEILKKRWDEINYIPEEIQIKIF